MALAAVVLAHLVASPSAVAIPLRAEDGTVRQVDRDHLFVYLLGGHSNMAGRDPDNADVEVHSRAWTYRWWSDKRWVQAKDDRETITNRGKGGPAMPLLKQLVAVRRWRHMTFAVVQNAAHSATAQWKRDALRGQNRYSRGKQLFEELVKAAGEVKKVATIVGLILHLGYVESLDWEATLAFGGDLRKSIDQLRKDLKRPQLPVFVLKFERESPQARANPRAPQLLRRVKSIGSVEDRIAYVDMPFGPGDYVDNHHFKVSAHRKLMARLVQVMRARGWGPSAFPEIVEEPTIDPKSPRVGEPVRFRCRGSDPDRDPLHYTWISSGPGSLELEQNGNLLATSTLGRFSAAGSYTVTVFVSDGHTSLERELTVDVLPAASADAGPADAGGDPSPAGGCAAAGEAALGSSAWGLGLLLLALGRSLLRRTRRGRG